VLRVGERTLRRYVHEGRIAYSRLPGGQLRFSREAVDALLEPAVESSA
jgi:excisionase family DNA binding protein